MNKEQLNTQHGRTAVVFANYLCVEPVAVCTEIPTKGLFRVAKYLVREIKRD